MIDPRHPLFGRRFPVHWRTAPPARDGHVFVHYQGTMVLRLPTAATSLAPPRPAAPTKLTLDAMTELVTLARYCEALCLPAPPLSGPASLPPCALGSVTTSPASFRR